MTVAVIKYFLTQKIFVSDGGGERYAENAYVYICCVLFVVLCVCVCAAIVFLARAHCVRVFFFVVHVHGSETKVYLFASHSL